MSNQYSSLVQSPYLGDRFQREGHDLHEDFEYLVEQVNLGKAVYIENLTRSSHHPVNEYRVLIDGVNEYRESLAHSMTSQFDPPIARSQFVNVSGRHHAHEERWPVRLLSEGRSQAAIKLQDIRGWAKACFSAKARREFPQTVVQSYSGRVDGLDDSVFLVTLKGGHGDPIQLSFPIEMASESGLAAGDFVSYLIVRKNGRLDHEFRKQAPPKLSPDEINEIDQLVDSIFE